MDKSIHLEKYREMLRLLIAAREHAGVTQAELGGRLGETQSFISKCERGERRLDVVELATWCQALGVPLTSVVPE